MARPKRPTATAEPKATAGTQPLSPAADPHSTNGSGNGTGPKRRGRPRKNPAALPAAAAAQLEGKHHELKWYDEEGHGWEKRETKRDAYGRIVAFLKRHVLEETPPA